MEAARALNVHEEAVRRLDQSLELVLGLLIRGRRVKQILGHFLFKEISIKNCVNLINNEPEATASSRLYLEKNH